MGRDLYVSESQLSGTVTAPGSKSVTHRVLLISSLADGTSRIDNYLNALDTASTMSGLRSLGIEMVEEGRRVDVHGRGGSFSEPGGPVDLGNSGTSLRFLTTLAGLVDGRCVLTGDRSLRSRPMSDLLSSLRQVGVDVRALGEAGRAPIEVLGRGSIEGGRARISGGVSSQYVSSLLLSGPYFDGGLRLKVIGGLKSRPYVDLTRRMMVEFGVDVDARENLFEVNRSEYAPREYVIEGDYSSASFLILAGVVTGSRIGIGGLTRGSGQADEAFLDQLKRAGVSIEWSDGELLVMGGEPVGLEVDLSNSPDLVPPTAVLGAVSEGSTVIRGVEHARLKESDRLDVLDTELGKLGVEVSQMRDGLIVSGRGEIGGGEVDSHGDHRIAMALTVMGLRSEGLIIRDAGCVAVSYPGFIDDLLSLGAEIRWL